MQARAVDPFLDDVLLIVRGQAMLQRLDDVVLQDRRVNLREPFFHVIAARPLGVGGTW